MSIILSTLWSTFFVTPKYPTKKHTGEVIIVTGSNVGLGLEAARHFVRLRAAKVILACRSTTKAEAAKKDIEDSEKSLGVVETWSLDLASYESVKQFAKKCESLPRLDAVVENAALASFEYSAAEEHEATITINVISTFLLGLLLLPKLRETAIKFNITPRLSIVTSDMINFTKFEERKKPEIFKALDVNDKRLMQDRYGVSKLLEVFAIQSLAPLLSASKKPSLILNGTNPGFTYSALRRNMEISIGSIGRLFLQFFEFIAARKTEVGSRTLVAAIDAGEESHGKYMNDGIVARLPPIIDSPEGREVQGKVWSELSAILTEIQPGILNNI
ncbi:MAG: hypothetical protein M1814_005041 [Vezdaea aestivalis]|nr:MAG: hypothetical protein M1814_005041 [Vezdaea aestivalis]